MSLAPVKQMLQRVWQTRTGAALRERYKDLSGYRKIGLVYVYLLSFIINSVRGGAEF